MPPKFKKSNGAGKAAAAAAASTGPRVLYWFRTDLRLHDSPALTAALALKPSVFLPIWTWDPHYVYRARVGPNRWRFLVDTQSALSANLTALNPRQKLLVVREAPGSVLPKLWKAWGITHLVFERDTDAYGRERDEGVMKAAEEAGVEVVVRSGRTLYDADELVKANGGKPTMSMGQVLKAAAKIGNGKPDRPLEAPTELPDPGETDLSELEHSAPESDPDLNAGHRSGKGAQTQYGSIMGPNKDFAVPTLEEMGIDPASATSPHKGGETEGLRLLAKYIKDEEYVGTFEKPKSAPTAFEPQSTTLLSPHMHFGSVSVRKFYWDVEDVFEKRRKAKKHVAPEPMNLIGQLLFRDMYFGAQAALGWKFGQATGNPVCRFLPWHLQTIQPDEGSKSAKSEVNALTYSIDNSEAHTWFLRYHAGTTGFPWIDALMRQLRSEGWIHHLGRHALACFLTRGGCYIHWERGAEVFEQYLIDHEPACNAGNWMWLSCTAFFSQFYRCYSPVSFPKKWDPEGEFIRRYVPELKNYDKKFIYEPHKAPIADQKRWGCRVTGEGTEEEQGKKVDGVATYPKPMFDFNERRQICMDAMKRGYEQGLYGDSKEVMDGSWKQIFEFEELDVGREEDAEKKGFATLMKSGGGGGGKGGGKGQKRKAEEEYESDEGDGADEGDVTDEERKPPPRKATKASGK